LTTKKFYTKKTNVNKILNNIIVYSNNLLCYTKVGKGFIFLFLNNLWYDGVIMLRNNKFAVFIANILIIAQLLLFNAFAYGADLPIEEDITEKGIYKLSGYIKPSFNCTNNILAGFLVEIEKTQLSTMTDENGYFEICNLPQSDDGHIVNISKVGYLKRKVHINPKENTIIGSLYKPLEMWAGDICLWTHGNGFKRRWNSLRA